MINSQSEIYSKNNPRVTEIVVNSGFTKMEKTFGQYLQEILEEREIKPAELARQSGVTKQNISRLLNEKTHPISNAKPQTTKDTVEKIAKALNWNLDDALLAAGHAPTKQSIPAIISRHDYTVFNERDLRDIDAFIRFKIYEQKMRIGEENFASQNPETNLLLNALENKTAHDAPDVRKTEAGEAEKLLPGYAKSEADESGRHIARNKKEKPFEKLPSKGE